MKIKWDFSEFIDFKKNLLDGSGRDVAFRIATQNITRVLHQYLVQNTPVDTGKLKRMWSAGDNLKFTVNPVAGGFEVTLYNTASNNKSPKYPDFQYGIVVNDGNSRIRARLFVEKSIIQTAELGQIEQIIMKELQKWWDSL